jgi:hypothetical protein
MAQGVGSQNRKAQMQMLILLRSSGGCYTHMFLIRFLLSSDTSRYTWDRQHYITDAVYAPPFPQSPQDLRNRINFTVETIAPEMLQRVWQVFDYRIDVCQVTKGGHTESH